MSRVITDDHPIVPAPLYPLGYTRAQLEAAAADAERLGYRSRRQINGEAIPPILPDQPPEPSEQPYYDQIKHWWGE